MRVEVFEGEPGDEAARLAAAGGRSLSADFFGSRSTGVDPSFIGGRKDYCHTKIMDLVYTCTLLLGNLGNLLFHNEGRIPYCLSSLREDLRRVCVFNNIRLQRFRKGERKL